MGVARLVVVSLVLSVGATGVSAPARTASEIGVTKDKIIIGNPAVLSGTGANIARNIHPALRAYYDEVSADGGLFGRDVELLGVDAGTSDPAIAAASYQKLEGEAFIATGSDGTVFVPLSERFKVPLLYVFGTRDVGLESRYGFPVVPYNSYQAEKLLPQYLVKELDAKSKKVGVIYQQQTFLGESHTAFLKGAKRAGLDVVADQPVDPMQPTCAQEVANVKAANPDIVYADIQQSAVCVFREAANLDWHPIWVGTSGTWQYNTFLNVAPPGYFEGAVGFSSIRPLSDSECGDEYKDLMRKAYPDNAGILTDEVAYFGYLVARRTIMLLKTAGPKALTREKFVNKMQKVRNFDDGCMAPVSWGPEDKRAGGKSVMLITVKNNQWVTFDENWQSKF